MNLAELIERLPVWVELFDGTTICLVQKLDDTHLWGTLQPTCWRQRKHRVRIDAVKAVLDREV